MSQHAENWAVGFIRADGENPLDVREGFDSRGDAEYFGQCQWASPAGRNIEEVRVRRLPAGLWHDVEPASVCGGVRL